MVPFEEEDDDLWAGTEGQQVRKVRPENVHFAKKAKRVDVKRLKDDIWSGLKTLVPEPHDESSEEVHFPQDMAGIKLKIQEQEPITPIGEPKQFDAVIQSLRESYPREKMSEISTSFCFICLLHLANEEGLSIETARFDGQEDLDVGCLGEAEDVEVEHETYKRKGKSKKMGEGERKDRVVGELQALRVYKVGLSFAYLGSWGADQQDPTAGRAA